ncbi:MAG: helix-turn-helix transcriptional regulator [Hymenobacteraceae bacterium]|nr:helix-turn-helix transcriptional regulator [Hymenobacteraceae bacterium]MDX5397965.1 helix-turn-helix transcriptional regulator [Hymenobacteraceae bacterium]MDX5514037.1 helix-turn-helix transcriptional regulator [Hymenobacteraceae bacterium]
MRVKNTIKVERARHNYTKEKLAELAGVSRQTINAIEKGNYVPSTVLALRLARVFQVPVEQLFELEEEDLA